MFEVERKYRVRRRDFEKIQTRLFKRLLPAVPLLQEDRYLQTADPEVTLRVRCQKARDKVIYLRTEKRKCKIGHNSNEEKENQISEVEYRRLLETEQSFAGKLPLLVNKLRIEFYWLEAGRAVTICLDKVSGPDGIFLGFMVELETMVEHPIEVADAQKLLHSIAKQILPASREREKRGYRKMLEQRIAQRDRAK